MLALTWCATGCGLATAFLHDNGAGVFDGSPWSLMAPGLAVLIGWAVIVMRRVPSARVDAAAVAAPLPNPSLSA